MNSDSRIIASYPDYDQAERAVDQLSDQGFPVERVAIVGSGLRFVEQVTGRRGLGTASLQAAITGAVVGALLGWLFGLFNWVQPLLSAVILALWGVLIGAVIGAVIGFAAHLSTRGRRDFSATGAFHAERYDVVAESEVAAEAERVLGKSDTAAAVPAQGSHAAQ